MPDEPELAETLDAALEQRDADTLEKTLDHLRDDGRLIEALIDLSPARLQRVTDLLGDDAFGELLTELDPADAGLLLSRLAVGEAADVLEAMDPDEAADVVGEIEPRAADLLLVAMQPVEAEELRELLAYPPDTAGGRMTPAFVSINPSLRADQAVVALQRLAQEAETINYVYVTDDADHLLGVLALHKLVLSPPSTPVSETMEHDVVSIPVDADQERAAKLLTDHRLLAIPVVDDQRRLLGIITADDVADILEQETTEDIERLGGSQPLEASYLRAAPLLLWRKRIVWLLVLFAAEAYTGTVLRYFNDEIEAAVALSFFIPLLIGTGGNVGSQVVTTIIRAMALGDVSFRDIFRIVRKEAQTGVLLGAVMAVVAFGRAWFLGVGVDIGLTVAITISAIVIWASVVAAMLPLILRQLRVDPAVVSAPFISTLVDGTGLVIYFVVARYVLNLS